MSLSPGTRLGPYEIIAPVGAGGMGEVFRARDTRLGRTVAVKILPAEFAGDATRLHRFEQEARAASALNHPNIITVYDVGTVDGTSFLTMELVEGKSLRALVESGALSTRRALQLSGQIADGLAKAHAAGIIHRDLKPENVMVSSDGFAKILDFGLAKLTPALTTDDSRTAVRPESTPGAVLGTVGYMSPEQASGQPVDFRSDQFSFGAMLYEMVTGMRPFRRNTAAETLTAIIREEPQPVAQLNPTVPVPLRWIIERCLAKEADDRYASTKDLARDLKSIGEHLSESDSVATAASPRMRPMARRALAIAIVAVIITAAAAFFAGKRSGHVDPPEFRQVTFRPGTVSSARFAPDGRLLYGASWEGEPNALFENLPSSLDSRPLDLKNADVLAISSAGEMAVMLDRQAAGPFTYMGTLAQMSVSGATAPRRVLDNVREADWLPDGRELMVVRDVAGRSRIEFPVGHIVYEGRGWVGSARVSGDGSEVAFIDHGIPNDDGGRVALVDRKGQKRDLTNTFQSAMGLAWSPDGKEVWFTASAAGANRSLYAVSRSRRLRLLERAGGMLTIEDVSADGRVAVSQDENLHHVINGADQRDLAWFDFTVPTDLTPDGKTIAFTESGEAGGPAYSVFIRGTDGSPAVRLGPGASMAVSPDGRFLMALLNVSTKGQVILYPTGAGESRRVPGAENLSVQYGDWMPDGRTILITAIDRDQSQLYLQDVNGGTPRAISPPGYRQARTAVSPDGRWALATGPDRKYVLIPTGGGALRPLPSMLRSERPAGWTADSTGIYLSDAKGSVPRLSILNVLSGEKTVVRELPPVERAGLIGTPQLLVTPDGKNFIASYRRLLSKLFVLTGLR